VYVGEGMYVCVCGVYARMYAPVTLSVLNYTIHEIINRAVKCTRTNGWMTGSEFLKTLSTSDLRSRVKSSADRLITLTFIPHTRYAMPNSIPGFPHSVPVPPLAAAFLREHVHIKTFLTRKRFSTVTKPLGTKLERPKSPWTGR